MYKLFRFKLYKDIKFHIFNDFLILGSSLCNNDCSSKNYYSTLMIIGYPNNTDSYFDIILFLQENNSNSIDNIIFDLSKNFTIDNNIFGYIYDGIKIQNIFNDSILYLINNETQNRIHINDTLIKIENIKVEFINNIYNRSSYILYYSFIVTEPEYEQFNQYAIEEDNIHNYINEYFNVQRQKYIGKEIHFTIDLKEDLTKDCKNVRCSLCFTKNLTCITSREYQEITTIPTIPETTEITILTEQAKLTQITELTELTGSDYIAIENPSTIIITNKKDVIKEKMNITKNELNIRKVINEKEIGKNYEIRGIDFTLRIKPTNSSFFDNTTYVQFDECEKILRNFYNISNSSILTFFQIELNNEDSKSLINQIEYLTYDEKKEILDLSLCKNENIQIIYTLKDNIILNTSSISSFKDMGIDIFNIKDSFFTDLCKLYQISNKDIILEDRIQDIFQNYSLCDEGCTYNNFDIENLTIACDCKIKENISLVITPLNLAKAKKSSIADSNIAVVKCYKLVFSFEGKLKNIGFWIFLILIIANMILIIFYFKKGIKPILEYLFNEMVKNGYLKKSHNFFFENKNNNINNNDFEKKEIKRKGKKYRTKSSVKKIKIESNPNSLKLQKFILQFL